MVIVPLRELAVKGPVFMHWDFKYLGGGVGDSLLVSSQVMQDN